VRKGDVKGGGAGGLFGGGGPERYYHALDRLKQLVSSFPEDMTPELRRALGFPQRIRDGGFTMMAASGRKPIDPAALFKVPEIAEQIARISIFHLEQNADAGDKMLARWADGVRSDLASILKDLGYDVHDEGFDALLSAAWEHLRADADVRDALGELPEFDGRKIGGTRKRNASRGPGGAGGSTGAGSDAPQGGGAGAGELGGDPGVPGDAGGPGADVVPGQSPGAAGGHGERDGLPGFVPDAQRADYFAALGSDRVSPYVPLLPPRRGHEHPRLLVESKALAGVQAGDLAGYEPDPRSIGDLSDAQRDQVAQVGYRIHLRDAGALMADDVGVGKSRLIGGIIADQVLRDAGGLAGKRRVLLLTKNRQNVSDLIATFTDEMKATFRPLQERHGLTFHNVPDDGGRFPAGFGYRVAVLDAFNLARYAKGAAEFNPDLVVVDEAHLFSNLAGETERANVLETLHANLQPEGTHFVYMTATPASDISALKFMYGLKLWHPAAAVDADKTGTLVTYDQWLQQTTGVSKAGSWRESIAGPIIEQLMRELKMDHAYAALDFWRGGFEFEMREAAVDVDQLDTYDRAADVLRRSIQLYQESRGQVGHGKWPKQSEGAGRDELAGGEVPRERLSSPPRPDGQAIFFMKRLLVQFRMATAIQAAHDAIGRGEQVVFKILGVNDTHLTGEGGNLGAVLDAIPTWTAEKKGGVVTKWKRNADADHNVNQLRKAAAQISPAGKVVSPLKQILDAFGAKNVAAIVGATPAKARVDQNAEFQSGKRRVAVISSAGTTGINLQDKGTGRRRMIILDLDWDSKEFKQTLGRIDRTGQVSTPGAVTVYTPIAGERKFQATIASRLKSLGAIAKGQEDYGNTDALNDFDMESSTWARAINEVVRALPKKQAELMLHIAKLGDDELTWRDFQNDLMMLPHRLGNEIYDKAEARWRELEEEDRAATGGKVARRNRGLIRQSLDLDEDPDHPLTLHTVENVSGETYGILAGKLLTRPAGGIALPAIQDAIGAGKRAASQMFVTMQQGERIVSGLYVPRGRIETVKALFGKGDQRQLFGPNGMGKIPDAVLDQMPPRMAVLATAPVLPPGVAGKKHATRKGPPVSRQAITNAFIERLGATVGVGKSRLLVKKSTGKGRALGWYTKRMIRNHVANTIGTLAHEEGHNLADLMNGLKPPATFDHELLPLGARTSLPTYTKNMVRREGEAEWFRYYMLDPATVASTAPDYTAFMERELLNYPAVWRGIQEIQAMYAQYLAQDDVAKLESQIAFDDETRTVRARFAREPHWQYLYRHLFDGLAPLDWARKLVDGPDWRDPSDKTPKAGHLPDRFAEDAYTLARLNAGNTGMVLGWVKHGVRDRGGRVVADGLESVLRKANIGSQGRRRQFEAYLVALRVDELYTQANTVDPVTGQKLRELSKVHDPWGGALGITWDQARATVTRYKSPSFDQAAAGVHRWSRAIIDHWMRSSGAFDDAQLDALLKLNQLYVPLNVVMDETAATPMGGGGGLVDRNPRFHRIVGSGRRRLPPLAQLVRNTMRMVESVEGNRAAIKFFEKLRKSKASGILADKVARPLRGTTATLEEIKKVMIAAGVPKSWVTPHPVTGKTAIDLDAAFTIFRPTKHNPAEMEVALKMRGKVHVWQVHVPALYEAVTANYRPATNNLILRMLTIAKNVMRAGFTLPLEFTLGNMQRDAFTAAQQSRYGWNPLDFFRGLKHALTEDKVMQLFEQAKAGQATKVDMVTDQTGHVIRDLGKSKRRRVLEAAIEPWRWLEVLEAISRAVEHGTRVGEFQKALKREGVTEEGLARAALAARDVTVDFHRGGTWSREIGQWRAFFGAALQGPDVLIRNFKNRPWEMLLRALLGITLPSLILHYLSRDNPDYQERTTERQLYWLIPIGWPKTTRSWLRIRKPHELGVVFSNLAESVLESGLAKDPAMMRSWIPNKTAAFDMLVDLLPTAIVPAMEVGFNYDTFRNRPIVADADQHVEPELQYNRYTSETAKILAKALGWSPAKVDHLIYGYLGTFGRTATNVLDDQVWNRIRGLQDKPALPARGGLDQDVPGVRIFFSKDVAPGSAQSLLDFYAKVDRLRTVTDTLQRMERRGAVAGPEAKAYRDDPENQKVLTMKGQLTAGENQLKLLKGDMDAIFADRKLDAQGKRFALRRIATEMVNVARDVLNKPHLQN
jgi:hypothetical protein